MGTRIKHGPDRVCENPNRTQPGLSLWGPESNTAQTESVGTRIEHGPDRVCENPNRTRPGPSLWGPQSNTARTESVGSRIEHARTATAPTPRGVESMETGVHRRTGRVHNSASMDRLHNILFDGRSVKKPDETHPLPLCNGKLDCRIHTQSTHQLLFLGDLRWVARFEPNRCKPNRSTYRQPLPKVCQQQFHGQDEN